jgi:hypothetical protein
MISHPLRRALVVAGLFTVLLVSAPAPLPSQTPATPEGFCGSNVTAAEAQRFYERRLEPQPAPLLTPPPYCVPIAAHIVRTSAGSGGMPMEQLAQAMIDANMHFADTGIGFYILSLDYIDDDFYYSGIQYQGDIDALRQTNVVADAINIYFTPVLPGLCGISSFTFSAVQGIVMANGCTGLPSNHTTFSHELGHYFNLYHTHETAWGLEYVDGTNCGSAGDLLCDTPADPNLSGVTTGCVYTGGATDPHGDPYVPDVSQLMSYAPPECPDNFSPQSVAKVVNVVQTSRANLLVRGCDPVVPATVAAATPASGYLDETLEMVLVGTNFRPFTSVILGEGVTATAVDTLSSNDSLLVSVTIDAGATPGPRDVIVNNAYDADTLGAGFQVLDSPRHYVSPTGGARYPYARPQDAATTLAAAIGAASAGDSVLVDSTTVTGVTLNLEIPVILSGGWDPAFTGTDPAAKKTRLVLTSGILVSHGTGVTVIDGFIMEGGNGGLDVTPINGRYGGAVRVINSSAMVSRCELRGNDANTGLGFGGGGAVYASGSSLVVTHTSIHDNDATRGGGIYMYQSTGTIAATTIAGNVVASGGGVTPEGAGVAIHDCGAVTVIGCTIDGNAGAANGGGMWISGSGVITVSGGQVSGHTVTSDGAGIQASHSTLSLNGVNFSQNQAAFIGGGVSAVDTCTVTVSECGFTGNGALVGAAVRAGGGHAFIRHNIVAGNTAAATGAGIYVTALVGGEILGNSVDGNSGGSGAGGMLISSSPVDVQGNIVTNSTGDGVVVSGAVASFDYNLVWNSSGSDYNGVSPGTGALSADPLFADAPGGDYHLALHSPAIDTGHPDPAYDDPDGSRADMGRYGSHTFAMDQPSYPKNVSTDITAGQLTIAWDRNPEADVAFYAVYCDTVSGFVPSSSTLLTTTPDTMLTVPAPGDTTWYRVSAVDTAGYASGYSDEATSEPGTASAIEHTPRMTTRLEQNVPNPFNPATAIRFAIAAPARVDLVIYDVAGRRVRTLVSGHRPPDTYRVTWDGTDDRGARVASGIYFYRLTAGNFAQTRKMVLLK